MNTYKIKHFTPGKEVIYNGYVYVVNYILIRNNDLYVYLKGMKSPVSNELVHCNLTTFLIDRQ